jgi:uncharacterized protein YwqG
MDENLEETLEPFSMDAVHLVETKNNVFTKIGGQPVAGKDFKWPKWRDQSMAFIAQIKLSEMPALSRLRRFPLKGFLYVFYDKEQSTWGFDPNDKGSWNIIFEQEHDDLAELPYPQDIEDGYRYTEKKLEQKLIKTYPSLWEDERINALRLTDEQLDWCGDFTDSVYCGKPRHQIGGIASAVQSPEMDLECQLVSHGLYCGNASGYLDPRRKELEKNRADWILLLQIDTDDDAGFMWGDVGMLYFWIKKDDLEKLNFENVWMIFQCC